MKTALILTGHMRCWPIVFMTYKKFILDKFNPDVFLHVWNNEGWWSGEKDGGPIGIQQNTPEINVEQVTEYYKPVRMVVEQYEPFIPYFEERIKTFTNFYHRPKNICSMFYKMMQGVNMIERHSMVTGTKYDLVIRMRPDFYIQSPLPDFDPSKFYTCWHKNHVGKGTGDGIQVGSLENVAKYTRLGLLLEEVYAETGLLCPHEMSVHWIQKLGLPWDEFRFAYHLMHTPKGSYVA